MKKTRTFPIDVAVSVGQVEHSTLNTWLYRELGEDGLKLTSLLDSETPGQGRTRRFTLEDITIIRCMGLLTMTVKAGLALEILDRGMSGRRIRDRIDGPDIVIGYTVRSDGTYVIPSDGMAAWRSWQDKFSPDTASDINVSRVARYVRDELKNLASDEAGDE